MKTRFAALAAALVVSSVGCTALKPGCGDACGDACGPCGMPCHVATSQFAPRASMLQGRCPGGPGCVGCVENVGCGDYCGPFSRGCCGSGECGNSCLQNGLNGLLNCDGCNGCGDQNYSFTPGPPTGQTAYPYYTTRGPRDFLMANPPSIGPR